MSVPYREPKWRIVYGERGFALSELHARLCEELGENVPCIGAEDHVPGPSEQSTALLGTAENNPHIAAILGDDAPRLPQSYVIRTLQGEAPCSGQLLVIAGGDTDGLIYGVEDFLHRHADRLAYGRDYRERRCRPFAEPLPHIDESSCPVIKKRGIWTWGRCIYDYRGFFDNMARTKMNTAVIWNDVLPINGRELTDYAHSRGVKVIWGFSWGWSTDAVADISDPVQLEAWKERIVGEYERIWAPLGGDGIYFQTATECDERLIKGRPLAEWVVEWVNGIASALYERHPGLDIEFGLHATSVKNHTDQLRGIDPRLTVTWEDGGAFPFSYHAWDTESFPETAELTERMLSLRGENERAGFVFKGVKTLFWPEFVPAREPFVLGEASEETVMAVMARARGEIRTEQAWWLGNLGCLTELVRRIGDSGVCKGSVTVLCEDGCFERARWIPCVLFGETLWAPWRSPEEVIRDAALCRDAVFA